MAPLTQWHLVLPPGPIPMHAVLCVYLHQLLLVTYPEAERLPLSLGCLLAVFYCESSIELAQ